MTPKLQTYFEEYRSFHETTGNLTCHWLGIPMIATTLFGLLALIGTPTSGSGPAILFRFDAGIVLWSLSTLWYLFADWKIGLPFSLTTLGLYFIGRSMSPAWLIMIFVAGWVLQAVGHAKYEKKSPAFTRNFLHVLIGPLWIFSKLVGYQKA